MTSVPKKDFEDLLRRLKEAQRWKDHIIAHLGCSSVFENAKAEIEEAGRLRRWLRHCPPMNDNPAPTPEGSLSRIARRVIEKAREQGELR